ncbi:hydrolase [Methylorubrum populi]|uniref:Hydrolase n=1 Tax=Methylorubrum populi TaxID=223967 RepID=A0A160PAY5_9HYPH|nr:hypothetical protein [Methylorubrum populi]BAU89386.1 hydrolase [Methylorubrum populi]
MTPKILLLLGTAAVPSNLMFASQSLAASPPVVVKSTGAGASENEIRRAVEIFLRNCAPLNTYLSDIKEIRAEYSGGIPASNHPESWKFSVHVTMDVPNEPKQIPRYDPRAHVMAGHTLHYDLGGGDKPGFFASKRVSQLLCGMEVNQAGRDTFKSVPDLKLLK